MFFNFFKFNKNQISKPRLPCGQAGFTTLELMVVIGIFTIMTGVVLANLPKFRDQSAVGLVAQQISLVARQAQVYGNSGRQWQATDIKKYGLYFDIDTSAGGSVTSFHLFADKANFNIFDLNFGCGDLTDTECVERFSLPNGVKISSLANCDANPCVTVDKATIMFRRAYPDAQFFDVGILLAKTCTIIRLESIRDASLKKDIIIWSTGHIYTKNPPSPTTYSC